MRTDHKLAKLRLNTLTACRVVFFRRHLHPSHSFLLNRAGCDARVGRLQIHPPPLNVLDSIRLALTLNSLCDNRSVVPGRLSEFAH
jgi:hypothetical protein